MKQTINFLFALFFCACSTGDTSKIELYDEAFVMLEEDEKVYPYDQYARELYSKVVDSLSISIPLFKYGHSSSHELFVGIPIEPNLQEFNQARLDIGNHVVQDSIAVQAFGKYDGIFTSEVLISDKGKSVYLLCASKDSLLIHTKFDFKALKSRIYLANEQ